VRFTEVDRALSFRRYKCAFLALGLALASTGGLCADAVSPWDLSLRESVLDQNRFGNPASISYTNAQGGTRSYAIDAGLSLSHAINEWSSDRGQWDYAITAEDHKNTQLKKEMDTRAYSASLLGVVPLGQAVSSGIDLYNRHIYPTFSLTSKDGRLKGAKSVLATAKSGMDDRSLCIGFYCALWKDIKATWIPELGLQTERSESSANSPAGTIVRTYEGVRVEIWPWWQKVQVGILGRSWYDISRSATIDAGTKYHKYRNPYVAYRIWEDGKNSVDLRFDYVSGENPESGLQDQTYRQLGLKFSLTL
jgi:hypothetical protein